jgi:hypothetical protein
VTVEVIRDANDLPDAQIYPGTRLELPRRADPRLGGDRRVKAWQLKLFKGAWSRMSGIEKEIKKAVGGKKATGGRKGKKSGGSPEKRVAKAAKRLLK